MTDSIFRIVIIKVWREMKKHLHTEVILKSVFEGKCEFTPLRCRRAEHADGSRL